MIKVSTKIILIALQKALYCLAETQREVLTTSVEKHWNNFFFFIFIKKIKIYFKKLLIFKIYFCKLKKYILFFFSKILAFQYTLKFEFKKSSAKRPQRRRARRNGCFRRLSSYICVHACIYIYMYIYKHNAFFFYHGKHMEFFNFLTSYTWLKLRSNTREFSFI